MKTSRLARGALATLVLGCASVAAHAAPAQQVQVSGHPLRSVSEAELRQVQGRYTMSDGRQLRIRGHGLRVRAELQGENPVEVRAASATHWVSLDGRMTLRFSGDENVSNVRLTLERRLADGSSVGPWTLTSVSHSD